MKNEWMWHTHTVGNDLAIRRDGGDLSLSWRHYAEWKKKPATKRSHVL